MHLKPAAFLAAASACLLAPTLAGGALDPAVKCQAIKLKLSGKYAACRLLEDASATKAGTPSDYSTCDARLQAGWEKVESKIGSDCPTAGDLPEVQDSLVECVSTRYVVHFHMTSNQTLGALQFVVDYAAASGAFTGSSSSVSCENAVPGTIFAKSDDDDAEELLLGVLSLDGFTGPLELARCIFEVNDFSVPQASGFALNVTDATETNGTPVPGVTIGITIEPAP